MELKAPCLIPSRPLLFTLPLLGLPPPFVLHLAHMGCRPLSSYYTWHIEKIALPLQGCRPLSSYTWHIEKISPGTNCVLALRREGPEPGQMASEAVEPLEALREEIRGAVLSDVEL
jgi:hypothetical protein